MARLATDAAATPGVPALHLRPSGTCIAAYMAIAFASELSDAWCQQRLETYFGGTGQFMGWENTTCEPRLVTKSIFSMDRRTWQAFTTGYVELPRRRVHAGLWFRLLRTLLDELNTPISLCGSSGDVIRYVWERCGQPLRAGQSLWRPYEILNDTVQLQMLEAAATAIELIESKILNPAGEFNSLFLQEPQMDFSNGLPEREGPEEPINYWRKATEAIEEAIIDARHK